MEAKLLRILLGLFLGFLLRVESARVQLDKEKIAGFWKEVAISSDQNLVPRAHNRVEGLFLTFSGRNITVKAVYNSSGNCKTEIAVGSERDTPGSLLSLGSEQASLTPLLTCEGQREIFVLDTDYKHYAILRMSLLWKEKDFYVLKYFTRSLEDNEDEPSFWRFRDMTADIGLFLLARHGRCSELLKEVRPLPLVYIVA